MPTLPERGEIPGGAMRAITAEGGSLSRRDEEQEQAHQIAGFGAIGMSHSASLDTASSPNR